MKKTIKWSDNNSDPLEDMKDLLKLHKNPYYQRLIFLKVEIINISHLLLYLDFFPEFVTHLDLNKRKEDLYNQLKEVKPEFDKWNLEN